MPTAEYIFHNGSIVKADQLFISPDNRSFRYGDGFFETIKMINGEIPLAHLHTDRLFDSQNRMHFKQPDYFTPEYVLSNIEAVAKQNAHDTLARVRVTVFRGNGGLYDASDHFPHHLFQTWALDTTNNRAMNTTGLLVDFFTEARKTCDGYSSIKTNSCLPSVMGALWARQHRLDDALLLNPYNRIADATIANVFIVQDGIIKTPPLEEGPVNGVMRRYLLNCLEQENSAVEIKPLSQDDVLAASELFLTNAIMGIRWVGHLGKKEYGNTVSAMLYAKYISPMFGGL